MRTNFCNDHHSSVLCLLDMQFNKHAVVRCCMGGNVGECRSLTSFRRSRLVPLFLMLPLSFNTNFDGIQVLKQRGNRAIILAKSLSFTLLFLFKDLTPLLVR